MMNKIVVSHPTGNAFVRAAIAAFWEADTLEQFYTSIAIFKGSLLNRLSRWKHFSDISRRTFDDKFRPYIKTLPFYEIGRLVNTKLGTSFGGSQESSMFSIDNVYRKLDKYVAADIKRMGVGAVRSVYCYEDGAVNTFEAAKAAGLQCIYDLPIGYWRTMHRLLEAEKYLHPHWANTITGLYDPEIKLQQKDKELALADTIIVASSFTASTLKDFQGKLAPVAVVPYGFPPVVMGRKYQPLHKRPLRLLFVGHLSQRKGIANLFEAVAHFGSRVELTIVGERVVKQCAPLEKALNRHRWIRSLPQDTILQMMERADVLVFPSLFEGFGLVITEAMSQGTPVITTERTAGPDLIQHDENGWLIEAGNTEALKAAIEKILLAPSALQKAGEAALYTATKRPWYIYGQELIAATTETHNR